MTNKIDELLTFDPLQEAENVTGISYKDTSKGEGFDNPANLMGLMFAQEHSKAKREALEELDDTYHNMNLYDYQRVIEKYGFEKVLEDDFVNPHGTDKENETHEKYFVYAHKKGLLLAFDTFSWTPDNKPCVNGGSVYYQWKPLVDDWTNSISSGGMIADNLWSGSHDCREALIHNLDKLNNRGEFIKPWQNKPWLWLIHYGETKDKGYDHNAITNGRIKRLPQWVQDFIGSRE